MGNVIFLSSQIEALVEPVQENYVAIEGSRSMALVDLVFS
jgi:hypothetical protein